VENYQISLTNSGLVIEGVPDAIKAVAIDGPKAQRLAHLSLHKWDLEFALSCLEAINQSPPEPPIVRQALWRTAMIYYVKCFGVNADRFQLSADSIYKGENLALENFEFFKNLRNKHLVHDENSYLQGIPGAVLNNGSKPYKIEKIVCLNALGETLGSENYSNLHLLISSALEWVIDQFEKLCNVLTTELESLPYDILASKRTMQYSKPTFEDTFQKRNSF
jgi:hypothetical protein